MLDSFYENISQTSPTAVVIISIAIMLFFGFAMTRLTKLLKLPNVTAYITAGIIIGPYCLKLIPHSVIEGTDFIADIALAFIAFSMGEFFKLSALKKNGHKTVIITLCEAMSAALLVFVSTYFILGLAPVFCVVLSALASATAPTSTVMTIRQTGAKGDFVDTLLQVIAIDDILSLIAFSIAISLAGVFMSDGVVSASTVAIPILKNVGAMALGAFFGFLMKLMTPKKRTTDNRLIISVGILLVFCGICAIIDISPLLGCIMMGMVYINIGGDEKLFRQLNYFAPPFLLLFFVRSGMNLQLDAFFSSSGNVGGVPIIVVVLVYFAVRIVGKYGGAYLGSLAVRKPKKTRLCLGMALMPQAGVAIGLAALAARTLEGDVGAKLQTIILASSILYEIIGPAAAKLSLYLSGSYSDNIEDIAPVPVVDSEGKARSEVDILIDRIKKIQKELPPPEKVNMSPEEMAFLEAAEEQYDALNELQHRRFRKKR